MAIYRTDRKVLDDTTGDLVRQGEMLKILMKRAGIGRNQWHQKAEGISGPMSRLSDMFAGRRHVPLKDVVPLIEALNLSPAETDHYCCEYFRTNIPENLERYIDPARKNNNRYRRMLQRISDLQELVSSLHVKLYFAENVNVEQLKDDLKSSNESLRSVTKSYRSKYINLLVKILRSDFSFSKNIDMAERMSLEQDYQAEVNEIKVGQNPDFDNYLKSYDAHYRKIEYSAEKASKKYDEEINAWSKALHEIASLTNTSAELNAQIKCYLPLDVGKQLNAFMNSESINGYSNDPMESWDWVRLRVNGRSHMYVLVGLFTLWKKSNPIDFQLSEKLCHKFINAPRQDRIELALKVSEKPTISFERYLNEHTKIFSEKYPNLALLLRARDTPDIVNNRLYELSVFEEYFKFMEKGFSSKISFENYYESIEPSFPRSRDVFRELAPILAAHTIKIDMDGSYYALCNVFNDFGDACERFKYPADYVRSEWNKKIDVDELKALVIKLTVNLKKQGFSETKMIFEEMLENMTIPKFEIDESIISDNFGSTDDDSVPF